MPAARRTAAAAGALLLATALAGCGDHAVVPTASPTGADAAACSSFMHALPHELADQTLRSTSGPYVASYGDPAIVVACGVDAPEGFGVGAECQVADGVGWYLSPDEAYDDQTLDVTVTAAGYRPRVSVVIPARYRPDAVQGVIGALSRPVKRFFRRTAGCV